MSDIHKQAFIEEATELIAELEISLLEVEKKPDDQELIAKIFRGLHTIKGSSGMFGYDEITMFTHDIETVYDYIRNGELSISKLIIDLTLSACDQISLMLKNNGHNTDEDKTKEILLSFRNIVNTVKAGGKKTEEQHVQNKRPAKAVINEQVKVFYISFSPTPDIFLYGSNPVLLIATQGDAVDHLLEKKA